MFNFTYKEENMCLPSDERTKNVNYFKRTEKTTVMYPLKKKYMLVNELLRREVLVN